MPAAPVIMRRTYLHGLLSSWIESGLPKEVHKRGTKPFSLGLFSELQAGLWRVRLHLALDELVQVLPFSPGHGPEVPVHINGIPARLEPFTDGSILRCVRYESWDELASAAPRDAWKLSLLSPTMIRANGRYQAVPTPEAVIRHLRIRWHEFAPAHLIPDAEITVRDLALVSNGSSLRQVSEPFRDGRIRGSVGWLEQSAPDASPEACRRLGQWLALTPYVGIGSQTTHGFGVAQLL
jgi:CRISPR-associated endoribonuclease Cas6